MFEPDNSGVFGWLSALIVLVMVGVGLSLLTDRRFELSSNGQQLKVEIEKGFGVLEGVRIKHDRALGELKELEKSRNPQTAEISKLREQTGQSKERISGLTAQVSELQSDVAASQKAFDGYALEYRNQVWQAAVGEKKPFIALRNGRRYEDVTILRVTTVGMEISHRDGRARIDYPDLDASWQDRFLWSSSERSTTLAGENVAPPEPPAQVPSTVKPAPGSKTTEPAPDYTAARKLHADVLGWNNKVSMLKMQYQEARTNIGSRQNSPTGSLETWQQRANRLATELSQATMKREMARLKLADADPNDPLAQPYATDY